MNFGEVEVFTGQEMQVAPAAQQASTALANIEQSRAVAEVQASIVLAKANPRNEENAYMSIMRSCKRKSLAECASYSYRRGGTLVTGPSIRLAEVIARCWGNINYGFREVGRGKDYSEVEAFAHDLETNTRVTRQFQVKHWRDTREGGKALDSERDKYELVAGMAQRRVRSCLLELIPGDIVESAEEACKATLMQNIGNMEEQAGKIVAAFAEFGVTEEMIVDHLQRSLKSLVPADVVNLKRIYRSIRDGIAPVSDFFNDQKPANYNPANDNPAKTQHEPPPKKQAGHRTRPKVIEKFKGEIDVIDNSAKLDTWRLKHRNRIARDLPKESDQDAVFAYAEKRYRELQAAEKEPAARNEPQVPAETSRQHDEQFVDCPNGNGRVPVSFCYSECKSKRGCPAHDDNDAGSSSKLTMDV